MMGPRRCLMCIGALLAVPWLLMGAPRRQHSSPEAVFKLTTATAIKGGLQVIPHSVSWNGQEFQVDDGIHVLMNVVRVPGLSDEMREDALDRLGALGVHLRGRKCISEIIELYRKAVSDDIRIGILLCLVKSQDARALPLFTEALDMAKPPVLRLIAAGGLANWNERDGIATLIDLFSVDEVVPSGALGWEAATLFESAARRKEWGLPANLMARNDPRVGRLSDPELRHELQKRCRAWFEQNEHRFPDWKPGDPLPAAPSPPKNKASGE